MPKGRPKQKVESPKIDVPDPDKLKVFSGTPEQKEDKTIKNVDAKKKYACGCNVVPVDSTRIKEKCIKHKEA